MSVRAGAGRNGRPTVEIDCRFGSATIYLQGAHLTSWVPAGGAEVLFVSELARFAPGESIRGGVPICFPQFAELGPLPMHGFAHILEWEWIGSTATAVTLTLRDSGWTRALWPHRFAAEYSVELGAATLQLAFTVRNPGATPLQWTGTLHTFLALDVPQVSIGGVGPAWFVDRGHGSRLTEDPESELRILGATDRAYLSAGFGVQVDDGHRRLEVVKSGFRDTVVWNPGPETSDRFPDLRPDDHLRFACIEAAELRQVTVSPADNWRGGQALRIATR